MPLLNFGHWLIFQNELLPHLKNSRKNMLGFRTTRKVLGFDEVQLCHVGALLRVQIPECQRLPTEKKKTREETPLFGDVV